MKSTPEGREIYAKLSADERKKMREGVTADLAAMFDKNDLTNLKQKLDAVLASESQTQTGSTVTGGQTPPADPASGSQTPPTIVSDPASGGQKPPVIVSDPASGGQS